MVQRFYSWLIVLASLVALTALPAVAGCPQPPASAQAVWTTITQTDPYTHWAFFPGLEGMYPGKSPHGAYLKVYVNDTALKAAKEDKPMPYGAIIVKENYGKDKKTLMAVTPMYKVKGYNPQAGDWFWAKYGPGGKVMKAGKVKGCIKCHSMKKNEDWRFLHVKK